jgi:multiple sugar transport system permease protein
VFPYLLVLLFAGLIPVVYAVYQSVTDGSGGFAGVTNFVTAASDYRFVASFEHIALVLVVWLPIMLVGVIALSLLVHETRSKFSASMRFIFYLPGALAGMANFVLWLFILDPTTSPIAFLWKAVNFNNLNDVASPDHMPAVLTAMLFFQGAGTWLVIVYGGLNAIPEEVLEAASIDGAGPFRRAIFVKLPMIRPWIAYMALMNIAYGFQLFLEPAVLNQATHGVISPDWGPNQLSYTYAFSVLNVGAAAAISVILLIITLLIGLVIVFRTSLAGEDR